MSRCVQVAWCVRQVIAPDALSEPEGKRQGAPYKQMNVELCHHSHHNTHTGYCYYAVKKFS